jgi:hypothetical protein
MLTFALVACARSPAKAPVEAFACGKDVDACVAAIAALKTKEPLEAQRAALMKDTRAEVRTAYFGAALRLRDDDGVRVDAGIFLHDDDNELRTSAATWLCEHGDKRGCDDLGVSLAEECTRQRQLGQLGFLLFRDRDAGDVPEVAYVCPNSPADAAQLKKGDIIDAVNLKPTDTVARLQLQLGFAFTHLPCRVDVSSAGVRRELTVQSKRWR